MRSMYLWMEKYMEQMRRWRRRENNKIVEEAENQD